MSKLPVFKFFSNSKVSVSDVNKYYVGVKPQPTMNYVGRIWKRSIKDSPSHPELAAPLVADEKAAYKGGCSQSISGSYHLQEYTDFNINKFNVGVETPTYNNISLNTKERSIIWQCLRPHSPRRVAFTLAEVLITLGIIGVVAAMTLPILIADYKEKQTVTQLKKVYSVYSNAYNRLIFDNGTLDTWGLSESAYDDDSDDAKNESDNSKDYFLDKLSVYLNTVYKCKHSEQNCNSWSAKNLGGAEDAKDIYENLLVLADGSVLAHLFINSPTCSLNIGVGKYLRNVCGSIHIDLNGDKQPNTYGKDIFEFLLTKDGLIPSGLDNINVEDYGFKMKCMDKSYRLGGIGCTGWVIYKENMEYLKCDDLNWQTKKTCK